MNEEKFWSIIEEHKNEDDDDFIKNIKNELRNYSESDLVEFEMILRKKIIEADNFNVMIPLKIIEGYVSDDSYLYFICWLISKWKKVYNETILNPDYLADLIDINTEAYLEDLLYVSTEIYADKTKKEEDDSFPRNVCIDKWIDYDSTLLINTKGEDWTEEDLPTRAPKLFKLFND